MRDLDAVILFQFVHCNPYEFRNPHGFRLLISIDVLFLDSSDRSQLLSICQLIVVLLRGPHFRLHIIHGLNEFVPWCKLVMTNGCLALYPASAWMQYSCPWPEHPDIPSPSL
jgi:hypothetical protein